MEALLNNPSLVIIIVLATMNVMLVAAVVSMGYRMNGNVPPAIAMALLNSIPQSFLTSGAQQVDDYVKSTPSPKDDWIGDTAKSGANLLASIRSKPVASSDVEPSPVLTFKKSDIEAAVRAESIRQGEQSAVELTRALQEGDDNASGD